MSITEVKSEDLHFDMKEPCSECPFRKSTPWHRKGIGADMLQFLIDTIVYGGEGSHSCHVTDPRSDHEPAKDYKGTVQHCVGFMRMVEKGFSKNMEPPRTSTIERAITNGELAPSTLKDPKNECHSIRDLFKACEEMATSEEENGL